MSPQTDPHAVIDALIEQKKASADGSLQVVLAIASVSDLVTVNTTVTPFTFRPLNLPSLAFKDRAVGISDGQMPIFKSNLAILLPQIADDIDKIPDNAAMTVRKVAAYIDTCLLRVS